jgi:hypothetical protein
VNTRREQFQDGTPRLRFVFQVGMAVRDRPLLESLQFFLSAGRIVDFQPRKPGWLPISRFEICDLRCHQRATIPFAERFLLPCAKGIQCSRSGAGD